MIHKVYKASRTVTVTMPKKKQESITVPEWIWKKLSHHYYSHEDEYKRLGIKSPTRLLCIWIVNYARGKKIEG